MRKRVDAQDRPGSAGVGAPAWEGTLKEFLRARRAAASTDQLPFLSPGKRRVPGLRREEVAMMAGVSVDYYRRLEQGSDTTPSPPVVAALSEALGLTDAQAEHLHSLAGLRWDPTPLPAADRVNPGLREMMDSWPTSAAFIVDPLLDIVETNRLAAALFAPFAATDNLAEMVFCDPVGRTFYADWARAAHSCVAALRASGPYSSDRRRQADLLERLLAVDDFERLWRAYDVEPKTTHEKVLRHPDAGEIPIRFHTLRVAEQPGYELVVYQAEPGGAAEDRLLSLLGEGRRVERSSA